MPANAEQLEDLSNKVNITFTGAALSLFDNISKGNRGFGN